MGYYLENVFVLFLGLAGPILLAMMFFGYFGRILAVLSTFTYVAINFLVLVRFKAPWPVFAVVFLPLFYALIRIIINKDYSERLGMRNPLF